MAKAVVAIVGRPNVGKSTLFNRLTGQRRAIVDDVPGTTRDRIYGDLSWGEREFTIVDTGGLVPSPDPIGASAAEGLIREVQWQAKVAIEEADAIVLVVDAKDGLMPLDLEVAELLRKSKKPVVLAANKVDNEQRALDAAEFHTLGLGDPLPISAYHGHGVWELLDSIVTLFPPAPEVGPLEGPEPAKIAIIGRPNVGKSSLLNKILGQERAIVDEKPGTTRDALDTYFEYEGRPMLLVDTAGIRRRGRIMPGVEKYSVLRALRALERADIAILVVDSAEGVTAQDTHIAGYARELAKGLIIAMNKWDLVRQADRIVELEYLRTVREEFKFVAYAPVVFLSALKGYGLPKIMSYVQKIDEERRKRVPTAALNQVIGDFQLKHSPPSVAGRPFKIYYGTQTGINPPTFVFFVNDPELLHFSYERYIENQLRQIFGFDGTGLRFIYRQRGEKGEGWATG